MFCSGHKWPECWLILSRFRWQKPYYISVSGVTSLNWHFSSLFVPDCRVLYWFRAGMFNGEDIRFPRCHQPQCLMTPWQASVLWEIFVLVFFLYFILTKKESHSEVFFLVSNAVAVMWEPRVKMGLWRACRDGGPMKEMNKSRNWPIAG